MDMGTPIPQTTFVGRKSELTALRRLRSASRLLTLTGPGGCGKTRIAYEMVSRFQSLAVVWIDLAPIRDSAAVAPAVERALGLAGDGSLSQPTIAAMLSMRGDHVVVALDNCEHVIDAAAACATRLLDTTAGVSILATSRTPLRIDGEVIWRVPPLSVPSPAGEGGVGEALAADAVRLFVERARLAQPSFILDWSTCADIVAICRATDGLPLAIELAAARTRHMSIAALARTMTAPLRSLAAERGVDYRHPSLRATIEWSHALLDATEQRVFRRLGVFAGGFTLQSAEAVCADLPDDFGEVVQAVTSLTDQSLVEFSPREDRYRMLVPIHEYAVERLSESGEMAVATERAARFLTRLATVDLAQRKIAVDADALIRREFANTAAVLPWLIQNDTAAALGLLARYAEARWTAIPVHLSVVSEWLDRALARWPTRDALRARCLLHRARLEREVSDDGTRVANARRAVDEALAIALELKDSSLEIVARQNAASVAIGEGDPRRAIELYDSVIPVLQPRELAMALSVRSVLRKIVGDGVGAEADIDAAFAAWDRHGDPGSGEPFLTRLTAADVAFRSADLARASGYLRDAIVLLRDGGQSQSPAPFELLAHLAAAEGDHERALRLASFAERLRSETGLWPSAFLALADRSWMPEARRRLGARSASICAAGRRMPEDEAVRYALTGRFAGELTRRELDVASLVASGLTDKEIGARLWMSERTAENHVQHIRQKLGLRSRAQIGTWLANEVAAVPR